MRNERPLIMRSLRRSRAYLRQRARGSVARLIVPGWSGRAVDRCHSSTNRRPSGRTGHLHSGGQSRRTRSWRTIAGGRRGDLPGLLTLARKLLADCDIDPSVRDENDPIDEIPNWISIIPRNAESTRALAHRDFSRAYREAPVGVCAVAYQCAW